MDERTLELIPITVLNQILLDKNEMQLFFHFEENRNHFLEEYSYDEYYYALDDYAAQLIKEEYNALNKELISSYVNNFLFKNSNTDKFYGSNLIMTYIINPKAGINYFSVPELRMAVELFYQNKEKAKNHYLKIFSKKDLVLDLNLKKVLNNLINFYGNDEFVLKMFYKGNDELKQYLINNYSVYFSIEKLSYAQLVRMHSYYSLLLKSPSNYDYFTNLDIHSIKIGKSKLIHSFITSNDEVLVKVLGAIKFNDSEYIKHLVSKLKDNNKLDFLCFSSNGSLSCMRISELNQIISMCNQEKIIYLLNEYDNYCLPEGYAQDLYLSLIINIKDKHIQKEYILKNIESKIKFNNKTIYNLMLGMRKEVAIDLLSTSEFLKRFNVYEMTFLLHLLEYKEHEIISFINCKYNKNYSSYCILREEYIRGLQREIKEQKDIYYTNSLFYAWGSGDDFLLNFVSIQDILKFLFSNKNLDKKFDISTMESILYYFFNENLDNRVEVNFKSPVYFNHNVTTIGWQRQKKIDLNEVALFSTPRENINIISAFFHEKTHYLQDEKMKKADPDFRLLQIAKELIMYEKLVYGDSKIKSLENYCKLGIECDANLRGILETISFFQLVNPDLAKGLYKLEKLEFQSYLKAREKKERKDLDNGSFYDVDYLFDISVTKRELISCIQKFPILLYEYYSNGEKRSVVNLFIEYNNLLYEWKNFYSSGIEYDKHNFMRKIRMYKELIQKRQKFITYEGKIISNKKEKFNDWVLLVDELNKHSSVKIQIVDYLIASILSFLQVYKLLLQKK